ncbi:hypothetical protein COB52_02300 [Candidatus Kaiserbacteria bacterium]|nr:MAG: hypothetical protein COB52_02300 [Candidatus Kaiserbacteria bacterium]
MQKSLTFLILGVALIIPSVVFGGHEGGIVPCHGADCGFDDLIQIGQDLLTFMIGLGIIISAVMFAYAGWLFFSGGGNEAKITKGKGIFTAVVIGLIILLVAWLVIDTLLKTLTGEGFSERGASVDIVRSIV